MLLAYQVWYNSQLPKLTNTYIENTNQAPSFDIRHTQFQIMKAKSFQQSLLQQILGLQQSNFPSFTYSNSQKQNNNISASAISGSLCAKESQQNKQTNRIRYRDRRPLSSSITDIQDQLIKMKINAQKSIIKENSTQNVTKRTKNIKTQVSIDNEQFVPPANYSTIYTRRSSLDQSLYEKALREQSAKKQWVSRKQQQKQNKQMKKCTYKPCINQTSKEIMSKINKEELYVKMKKKKEDLIKKALQQADKKQMMQCSFTPKISSGPCKLIKSVQIRKSTDTQQMKNIRQLPRNSVSIFDHLYQDSKLRQIKNKQKQQRVDKENDKKPSIDEISKLIMKDSNFQQRMMRYEKKRLQKQSQIKQKQNKQLKQSYRPSINNSSILINNRQANMSIGQHLYLQSKRGDNSKTPKKSKNQQNKKNIQINKKSTQFYQQRKTMVFYQIFSMLDGDKDGIISINQINIDALPRQIIKIIYPLIQELEVMQVQLHQNQFISSISNLFKTLTVHEKNILLGFIGGSQKQPNTHNFQPKINENSKIIASCNQRSQLNIYQYCSIRQAQKQRYLQTERVQKSKRELQSCTFQPKIIINKRY